VLVACGNAKTLSESETWHTPAPPRNDEAALHPDDDGTRHASRRRFDITQTAMPQDTIDWQKDVDAAIAQAKRDNKPLLLDFTAAPA
jgi:hypothetical protein